MGHRILLPVAFALSALVANAQSMGEIRGKVLDEKKEPVPFATVVVSLSSGPFGTMADEEGRYVLKPLPAGTYAMTAKTMGKADWIGEGIEVYPDQFTSVDIVMKEMPRVLPGVVVKAKPDYIHTRPKIDPEQTGRQTLLASEFAKDPNRANPIKFVSSSFVGVTASRDNEGLHFKGSRTENMASFVDGVRIAGRLPRVPSSAISSVTVYTGGLPAKYGDVTGGVVVIETKTYQELWAQERAMQLRREYDARQTQEALEQQQLEEKKPHEAKEEIKDTELETKPEQGQEQPPLEQPEQ